MSNGSLTLELFGGLHEIPCEELGPKPSPHTGKPLRRVSIGLTVSPDESEKLVDTFAKARKLGGALRASDDTPWVVTNSSHSYREGSPMHDHHADLIEAEEFNPERIEMLDLWIKPTRYAETARDDGLTIEMTTDLMGTDDERLEEQIKRLRDADDLYFDVRRVGINDTPIRMRFGRCLWQKTASGRAHLIYLVSEEGDTPERQRGLGFLDPQFGHAARLAFAAHSGVKALVGELVEAGALSEEAESRVRERITAPVDSRPFDEVTDVSEYFSGYDD